MKVYVPIIIKRFGDEDCILVGVYTDYEKALKALLIALIDSGTISYEGYIEKCEEEDNEDQNIDEEEFKMRLLGQCESLEDISTILEKYPHVTSEHWEFEIKVTEFTE